MQITTQLKMAAMSLIISAAVIALQPSQSYAMDPTLNNGGYNDSTDIYDFDGLMLLEETNRQRWKRCRANRTTCHENCEDVHAGDPRAIEECKADVCKPAYKACMKKPKPQQ